MGMRVLVLPSRQVGSVKSLEVDSAPACLARAGDSVDITLADVDASVLAAGAVICHPDWPVPLARKFTVRVLVLEVAIPILQGQQVSLDPSVYPINAYFRGSLVSWSRVVAENPMNLDHL